MAHCQWHLFLFIYLLLLVTYTSNIRLIFMLTRGYSEKIPTASIGSQTCELGCCTTKLQDNLPASLRHVKLTQVLFVFPKKDKVLIRLFSKLRLIGLSHHRKITTHKSFSFVVLYSHVLFLPRLQSALTEHYIIYNRTIAQRGITISSRTFGQTPNSNRLLKRLLRNSS